MSRASFLECQRRRVQLAKLRELAAAKVTKHRQAVITRDGGRCKVCGTKVNLVIDHVVPISKGGSFEMDNMQLLCAKHNRLKHNQDQKTFMLKNFSALLLVGEQERASE